MMVKNVPIFATLFGNIHRLIRMAKEGIGITIIMRIEGNTDTRTHGDVVTFEEIIGLLDIS